MMKIYPILIILFTLSEQSEKLIFVMTHFRHGARAPNRVRNNTDGLGEKWNRGGELTSVGKRMHYLLGYRNRIRYVEDYNFLSEKYNSSEIKIYCSTVSRAQLSLSSHLQGLYPPNEDLGEDLNEKQLINSDPPVNVSDSRLEKEKEELKTNALPNSMTFIPFEVIDLMGKTSCRRGGEGGGPPPPPPLSQGEQGGELEGVGRERENTNSESRIKIINEFNEKYKENYSQFIEVEKSENYTFREIGSICEDFISDYVDGRELEKFSELIDTKEFYSFCIEAFGLQQGKDRVTNNETEYASGTYLMKLLVDNTKLKIDEDIGKNESSNINPKIIIVSGHDTTLVTNYYFLESALGITRDYYRIPTFASQMTFEIKRNDDNKVNRNYSDYYINYYFNDELLINMTVDEFLNKIEPHIMTDEEINSVCNPDDKTSDDNIETDKGDNSTNDNNTSDNSTNNDTDNNNENVKYHIVRNDKYHNALLIVFASLFGVSLLINIFTIYKLFKRNSNKISKANNENTENNISISKNN